MSAAIETRRFDTPDQLLDMKARGRIAIVKMADGTAGMHAIFEPGWVWEADEKPLLGNPPSCPMRHTGYCIAGRLVVRMVETNVKTNIGPATFSRFPLVTMRTSRGTSASNWCCSRRRAHALTTTPDGVAPRHRTRERRLLDGKRGDCRVEDEPYV